ncbi:protein ARMCX6 [Chionomys nivalis]|uniref:protein ARMCX6 n=1 Tax=Chionomys nivalis TaxID=269649 RepID=UPI002598D518|nr:protein ARMCX6 [Chionomys nivalis]
MRNHERFLRGLPKIPRQFPEQLAAGNAGESRAGSQSRGAGADPGAARAVGPGPPPEQRWVPNSLDLTKCASIQGKTMSTEPTNAGFPLSHNVSRHWASVSVVANRIPTPQTTVREKALCVPENPNTSIGNQGQIEMSIHEVCQEMVLHCCKSFLQQAGLNLLISMTVINNMLAKSVSDLKFPLISEDSGCAKVQGLEALVGLSEKPELAGEALAAQMLFSFMLPFMRGGNREMAWRPSERCSWKPSPHKRLSPAEGD